MARISVAREPTRGYAGAPDPTAGRSTLLDPLRRPVRNQMTTRIAHFIVIADFRDAVAMLGAAAPLRAIALVGDAPCAGRRFLLAFDNLHGAAIRLEREQIDLAAQARGCERLAGAEGR